MVWMDYGQTPPPPPFEPTPRPTGGPIEALHVKAPIGGAQIALLLHPAQHGIERTGAEPVAVPAQFLDHPVTDQRFFAGMMQNVQPDKAGKPGLVAIFSIVFRCCHSMSNFSIESYIQRGC